MSTGPGRLRWPPTNFTDWNEYKVGAVTSTVLFFLSIVLWVAIGCPVFKCIRRKLEQKARSEGFIIVSSSTDTIFGFLPIGVNLIGQNVADHNLLKITMSRKCCCRTREVLLIQKNASTITVARNGFSVFNWSMVLVMAFTFSMFCHFVPCLWWTCDLGPGDGSGVRGLTWLLGFPLFCFLFTCLSVFPYYVSLEEPQKTLLGLHRTKTHWISIGNNRIYCRDKVSREIQRLEGSHEHTPIVTYIEKDTVDSDSTESIYRLEVQ